MEPLQTVVEQSITDEKKVVQKQKVGEILKIDEQIRFKKVENL